jgi:hypothetical protein
MIRLFACALTLVVAAGAWPQAQMRPGKGDPRFVGNWRLVSFVNIDDKGVSTPNPFTGGRIMYDAAGQMAAQLTHANRVALPADPSDALRAAASRGYVAYYGGYEIDSAAAKVTHHVEGSTNPNWPTTDLIRYYEFADGGDTLKLSIRNDAGRTTGTLTWARIR